MIKTLATFTLLAFLGTGAYAAQMNFKLMPKASKVVSNNYSWTLEAICTIQANQPKNELLVKVTHSKGTVNGKSLAAGQTTSVVVDNNESISVVAEPGAQVNVMNLSSAPIQAECFG